MSLETDTIVDRRRLKRALIFWRIAAIVAAVSVGAVAAGRLEGVGGVGGHVGEISVEDLILDDSERLDALADALDDDSVKALIVRINSPGGTVVGGETLFKGLRSFAEKKPVVAVMGELATSAGYMVALGADRIYAHNGTLTGSIGVLLQTADVTGLMDKIGVKPELVKSGALKAQPNPMEPFSKDARQAIRAVVMDMYDQFVALVAERRGLTADAVRPLADGRVFTGRQALGHGLIDAIGGVDAARTWLSEQHDVDADLPLKSIFDEDEELWLRALKEDGAMASLPGLVSWVFEKTVLTKGLRLDGLVSVWHP